MAFLGEQARRVHVRGSLPGKSRGQRSHASSGIRRSHAMSNKPPMQSGVTLRDNLAPPGSPREKTMKILMIAPQPFFEARGTPISVYQRLEALSALEYEVDLLTYHMGEDVPIPGVRICRSVHLPFMKNVKVGPSWPKVLLDILLFLHAVVLLTRNRYDVIHTHEEAAFFTVPLSRAFGKRHVYDMHSSLPRQLAALPRWRFWPFIKIFEILERWVLDTCDVVIVIDADLERHVRTINPDVTTVLIQNLSVHSINGESNPAAADRLREKIGLDGKVVVVYTGNLEHYQGLDLLVKSACIVREQCPEVAFVVVGGDARQVAHWQQEAAASGLGDSIYFPGRVPLSEAVAYLDLAEILVSPRTDGTSVPLKIYSYLRAGKPIVATDLPAHSQVLTDEMAILVAPTAKGLAQGILTLAHSPGLRQNLGSRGRELGTEWFKPADYVSRLEAVYQAPALSPPSDDGRSSQKRWLRLR